MLHIRFDQNWPTGFRDIQVRKCKHFFIQGQFFRRSRAEKSVVQSGRNSNSSKILCMSSLPASIKRIGSKTTEKRWRHRFPLYKPMGTFCCFGNQSCDPIGPKTICSLSPTQVMLHIISDQDWPNGFRDIQVWKCGRRRRRTIGIL